MTNDFPGTKLPDLSKLPATDREKQIAAEYSRISIEDTVPILVVGHQSFQLGGLTGLGDDQANWTCWMLAKAIQKIEDAVYDKVEAAIAKDLADVDPNIVLMEAEARDRERIHVTDTSIWSNPSANIVSDLTNTPPMERIKSGIMMLEYLQTNWGSLNRILKAVQECPAAFGATVGGDVFTSVADFAENRVKEYRKGRP